MKHIKAGLIVVGIVEIAAIGVVGTIEGVGWLVRYLQWPEVVGAPIVIGIIMFIAGTILSIFLGEE
jgi:branched-subunit amino acid transport protein AzlD